jgi:hypothetical protein
LCTLIAVALPSDNSARLIPQALTFRVQLLGLIEVGERSIEITVISGGASFPHVLLGTLDAVAVSG